MTRKKSPTEKTTDFIQRFEAAAYRSESQILNYPDTDPETVKKAEVLRDWVSTGTLDEYTSEQLKEIIVGGLSANATFHVMGLKDRSRQGGYARAALYEERDEQLRELAKSYRGETCVAEKVRAQLSEMLQGIHDAGYDGTDEQEQFLKECQPTGELLSARRISGIIQKK